MQLDVGSEPPFSYIKYIDKHLDVGNYRVIPAMNHFLRYEFWSSHELWSSEFWSSHRRTDRQKAMHMSPPCLKIEIDFIHIRRSLNSSSSSS